MCDLQESGRVRVFDHMFAIADGGEVDFNTGTWANGLIQVLNTGAAIYCGIDSGDVEVRVSRLDARPNKPDTSSSWDEIVDVTLTPTGRLYVADAREIRSANLIDLNPPQIGSYRIRVHASGRDKNYDRVVRGSTESYFLQVWPTLEADELIVKATDWCGRSLRAAVAIDARAVTDASTESSDTQQGTPAQPWSNASATRESDRARRRELLRLAEERANSPEDHG